MRGSSAFSRSLVLLALAGCGGFRAPPCTEVGDTCITGTRCEVSSGTCVRCDADHDGYLFDAPTCAATTDRPADCDDADPSVHPGAVAICGDGRLNGCDLATHDGLSALLAVDEASTFELQVADVPLSTMEDHRVALGLTQGGATGAGIVHLAWSVRGPGRHVLQLASFPLDAPDDDHIVPTTDTALRGAFPFDARWVDLRWVGPGDPNAVALATYGTPSAGIHEHAGGYLRDLASGDIYPDVLSDDTGYATDTPAAPPMAMTGGGASDDGGPVPLRVTHERDWTGHGTTLFASTPTAELPDASSLANFDEGHPPLELRASDGRWALIASLASGLLWTWNAAARGAEPRLLAPVAVAAATTTPYAPFASAPAFARLGDGERYLVALPSGGETVWGRVDLTDPAAYPRLSVVFPRAADFDPYRRTMRVAADHVPGLPIAAVARVHAADTSALPIADAPFVTLAFATPALEYAAFADLDSPAAPAANELHHGAPMTSTIADLRAAAVVGRDGAVNAVVAGVDVNPYDGRARVWTAGVRICARR